MKILYLCDEYPPGMHGGIGTAVQTLARAMALKGHRVWSAGLYDYGYGQEDVEDDTGVKVYRLRKDFELGLVSKKYSIKDKMMLKMFEVSGIRNKDVVNGMKKLFSFIEQLIEKHDIDIIEMPDYWDGTQYLKKGLTFPSFDIPVIVKCHGSKSFVHDKTGESIPDAVFQTESNLLKKADAIVACSEYTANETRRLFGIDRQIKVLYNGVPEISESEEDREENQVLFAGSLTEIKGLRKLMEAWNIVHEKAPQAKLDLYGKGNSDQWKALLSDSAKRTVTFHGHMNKRSLWKKIKQSSFMVLPSLGENFALLPIEAMACGTAVIYTNKCSGPELIQHGIDGILVDPHDAQQIAGQILYLLNHKQTRDQIAERGRIKAQRFNIDKIAGEHQAFYEEVITRFKAVHG